MTHWMKMWAHLTKGTLSHGFLLPFGKENTNFCVVHWTQNNRKRGHQSFCLGAQHPPNPSPRSDCSDSYSHGLLLQNMSMKLEQLANSRFVGCVPAPEPHAQRAAAGSRLMRDCLAVCQTLF